MNSTDANARQAEITNELIRQCWLNEFGDDSHISLHCYTLAYAQGATNARKATLEECALEA